MLGSLAAAIAGSLRAALASPAPNSNILQANPNVMLNTAAANEALVRDFINSTWNRQQLSKELQQKEQEANQLQKQVQSASHSTYAGFANSLVGNDCGASDKLVTAEDFQSYVDAYRRAFPDLHVNILSMQSTSTGVTVRWNATGTYAGGLSEGGKSITATGHPASISGTSFYRIIGGKITSMGMNYDSTTLVHQITPRVFQMPTGAGVSH